MRKYVVERVVCMDGLGRELGVHFEIKRRFLFLYFPVGIVMGRKDHDWNIDPRDGLMLNKYSSQFDTEFRAREIIHKLQHPYTKEYKNNTIVRYFMYDDFSDVYVNRSFFRIGYYHTSYEYHQELESLKEKIDKRTVTSKRTIL